MSLEVPFSYHAYEGLPSRGKWDQLWIARMLAGSEGSPPGAYRFTEVPWNPDDGQGRVLIMPMGAYRQEGIAHRIPAMLLRDFKKMAWCLLLATSDECSTFPWHLVDPWPEHCRLWVMTPHPRQRYPRGTRFISEGSPIAPDEFAEGALTRDLDLFFSGQVANDRRKLAWPAMRAAEQKVTRSRVVQTKQFLHSAEGELVSGPGADVEYVHGLTRSWVVPCPSGTCTQSSFRLYEALEAGCIPVADELSPSGGKGYWEMVGLDHVMPRIEFWRDLPTMVESLLVDRTMTAAHIASRWQQYKRQVVRNLHDDVEALMGLRHHEPVTDSITVLVLTSPVKSNPDLSMIQTTITSVRERLPGCEIVVLADGVREEQADMSANYGVFLHRLAMWLNPQHNMSLVTHHEHLHQSGLMRSALEDVSTPYVLFVEHDCPLVGEVPFGEILDSMMLNDLNVMRLSHEAAVLPDHEYLFLDPHLDDPAPWRETLQFSARPHLARTDWYRWLIETYFGIHSRTFIEDLAYGVLLAGADTGAPFADRLRAAGTWKDARMGLFHPDGDIKRSTHLDGRAGEPKYDIVWAYDTDRPDGAPAPGRYQT